MLERDCRASRRLLARPNQRGSSATAPPATTAASTWGDRQEALTNVEQNDLGVFPSRLVDACVRHCRCRLLLIRESGEGRCAEIFRNTNSSNGWVWARRTVVGSMVALREELNTQSKAVKVI